jgi:hypothetical protein
MSGMQTSAWAKESEANPLDQYEKLLLQRLSTVCPMLWRSAVTVNLAVEPGRKSWHITSVQVTPGSTESNLEIVRALRGIDIPALQSSYNQVPFSITLKCNRYDNPICFFNPGLSSKRSSDTIEQLGKPVDFRHALQDRLMQIAADMGDISGVAARIQIEIDSGSSQWRVARVELTKAAKNQELNRSLTAALRSTSVPPLPIGYQNIPYCVDVSYDYKGVPSIAEITWIYPIAEPPPPPCAMIATRLPSQSSHRIQNIAPYRRELHRRLNESLLAQIKAKQLTELASCDTILLLTIATDGSLIHSELLQKTGISKLDNAIINASRTTKFEPLPDWYKGEQLSFKIPVYRIALHHIRDGQR